MKTQFYILLFIFLNTFISCESEKIDFEESNTNLEATNLKTSNLLVVDHTGQNDDCVGYGFYENKQFDCGWHRGYSDWVYHYNWVVTSSGIDDNVECKKIRNIQYNSTKKGFTSEKIYVNYTMSIINQVNNIFQEYYENLGQNQFKDDFSAGMFAGYQAGRGQVPYSALPDECYSAFYKVKLPNIRYKKTKKGEEVGN